LANTTRQRNNIRRVQGQTLRELAYGELRRAVLTGQFAPGDPITIAELSKQLDIGLMPTREAVQQLASQGAFEFLPNRSVRVPEIAIDQLEQLFAARLLLEGFATAEAARLMTRGEAAGISSRLDVLMARLKSRDAAECLEANFEFHFSIYRVSHSPYVLQMIEHLWLRMSPLQRRVFGATKKEQDAFLTALPKHRALVAALRARDDRKARDTIEAMLIQSRDWHIRHAPER
jgi:DNA-binding GntR family transcriptional regulator